MPRTKKSSFKKNKKRKYNATDWYEERKEVPMNERKEYELIPQEYELSHKRKVALIIAYKGTAYSGSQMNPGVATIEQTVFDALVRTRAISLDNSTDVTKVSWHRACRTDKGVHAAGNILVAKIHLYKDETVQLQTINEALPDDIRLVAVNRVMGSFNPKNFCNSRTYEYVLPSYAFHPDSPSESSSVPTDVLHWRIPESVLERLRQHLRAYLGRKNYHNFTRGRKPDDPSCLRVIVSFTVDKLTEYDNVQFLHFRINGHSFMLNQIRKMIGTVIVHMRRLWGSQDGESVSNEERKDDPIILDRLCSQTRLRLPIAPALGLFLVQPHYDNYDSKCTATKGDDVRIPIGTVFKDQAVNVTDFISTVIYPEILSVELAEQSCWNWLQFAHSCKGWGLPHEEDIATPKC